MAFFLRKVNLGQNQDEAIASSRLILTTALTYFYFTKCDLSFIFLFSKRLMWLWMFECIFVKRSWILCAWECRFERGISVLEFCGFPNCLDVGKFEISGLCSKLRPAKLTKHSSRTRTMIMLLNKRATMVSAFVTLWLTQPRVFHAVLGETTPEVFVMGQVKSRLLNKAHLSSVVICNGLWNVFSGNKWHNVHATERKLSVLTSNLVEP